MDDCVFPDSKKEPIDLEYEVGEEIGCGTFSIVKEGVKKSDSLRVAIKYIDKDDMDSMDVVSEIEIMKHLNSHPGFVHLVDLYEDSDTYQIVMELVEGGELLERLIGSCYSEKDASGLMRQIADSVKFMHGKQILHRDIKPENLLFTERSGDNLTLKLCDFGIACFVREDDELLYDTIGSPGYAAPEVISDNPAYSFPADIYSVGIIMYIMLCGYHPFDPALGITELSFPSKDWDEISSSAKELITLLLSQNPSQRLTATQLCDHPWIKGEAVMNTTPVHRLNTNDSRSNLVKLSGRQKSVLNMVALENVRSTLRSSRRPSKLHVKDIFEEEKEPKEQSNPIPIPQSQPQPHTNHTQPASPSSSPNTISSVIQSELQRQVDALCDACYHGDETKVIEILTQNNCFSLDSSSDAKKEKKKSKSSSLSTNTTTTYSWTPLINGTNSRKQSPLYCAARQGHIEIVKLLLCVPGINPNQQESHGSTPLHVASFTPYPNILSVLLTFGCDTNVKNFLDAGLTAHNEARGESLNVWKLFFKGGAHALQDKGYTIWKKPKLSSISKSMKRSSSKKTSSQSSSPPTPSTPQSSTQITVTTNSLDKKSSKVIKGKDGSIQSKNTSTVDHSPSPTPSPSPAPSPTPNPVTPAASSSAPASATTPAPAPSPVLAPIPLSVVMTSPSHQSPNSNNENTNQNNSHVETPISPKSNNNINNNNPFFNISIPEGFNNPILLSSLSSPRLQKPINPFFNQVESSNNNNVNNTTNNNTEEVVNNNNHNPFAPVPENNLFMMRDLLKSSTNPFLNTSKSSNTTNNNITNNNTSQEADKNDSHNNNNNGKDEETITDEITVQRKKSKSMERRQSKKKLKSKSIEEHNNELLTPSNHHHHQHQHQHQHHHSDMVQSEKKVKETSVPSYEMMSRHERLFNKRKSEPSPSKKKKQRRPTSSQNDSEDEGANHVGEIMVGMKGNATNTTNTTLTTSSNHKRSRSSSSSVALNNSKNTQDQSKSDTPSGSSSSSTRRRASSSLSKSLSTKNVYNKQSEESSTTPNATKPQHNQSSSIGKEDQGVPLKRIDSEPTQETNINNSPNNNTTFTATMITAKVKVKSIKQSNNGVSPSSSNNPSPVASRKGSTGNLTSDNLSKSTPDEETTSNSNNDPVRKKSITTSNSLPSLPSTPLISSSTPITTSRTNDQVAEKLKKLSKMELYEENMKLRQTIEELQKKNQELLEALERYHKQPPSSPVKETTNSLDKSTSVKPVFKLSISHDPAANSTSATTTSTATATTSSTSNSNPYNRAASSSPSLLVSPRGAELEVPIYWEDEQKCIHLFEDDIRKQIHNEVVNKGESEFSITTYTTNTSGKKVKSLWTINTTLKVQVSHNSGGNSSNGASSFIERKIYTQSEVNSIKTWKPSFESLHVPFQKSYDLAAIDKNEFERIKRYFNATMPNRIVKVEKVINPNLRSTWIKELKGVYNKNLGTNVADSLIKDDDPTMHSLHVKLLFFSFGSFDPLRICSGERDVIQQKISSLSSSKKGKLSSSLSYSSWGKVALFSESSYIACLTKYQSDKNYYQLFLGETITGEYCTFTSYEKSAKGWSLPPFKERRSTSAQNADGTVLVSSNAERYDSILIKDRTQAMSSVYGIYETQRVYPTYLITYEGLKK
eukprot:TRINITY_DN424_c1_g4_i1.p1 TRINITY_DN424_c1_g4~~TRINITY_DN424_c1_g4_i1.p1  ORF type:complete len:1651 (-),score=500.85 TRINITY_DN424_c1_g4_i1:164-5116(-)